MDTTNKPTSLATLESVCDPVTVSVTDCSSRGDYHATRTVTVKFGACGLSDVLQVVATASKAASIGGEVS